MPPPTTPDTHPAWSGPACIGHNRNTMTLFNVPTGRRRQCHPPYRVFIYVRNYYDFYR